MTPAPTAHPADLAERIRKLPLEEAHRLFASLDGDTRVAVINHIAPSLAAKLFRGEKAETIADLLEEVSPDNAADILQIMRAAEQAQVLSEMEETDRSQLEKLLTYPEETAGSIMTTDFLAVPAHLTADEAIGHMRRVAQQTETIYYGYVVDDAGRLIGVLSLRDLIFAQPATPVRDLMIKDVYRVRALDDRERVGEMMQKYNFLALPVVDEEEKLLGIVTVDDAMDVMEEEFTEDLEKLSGLGAGDEDVATPAVASLRKRLPWMVLILFVYLIAMAAVAPFQQIIAQLAVLTIFMPLISTMGGNVGSQALAVSIRGLKGEAATWHQTRKVIAKEMFVGFCQGVVLGLLAALLCWLWQKSLPLSLLVGAVMWINIQIASLLGGLIPYGLRAFGFDPALMTGAILTTLCDALSFFIYLSAASLFLAQLT